MEAQDLTRVEGWGRWDASLCVVAEAPGTQEVRHTLANGYGCPLVGPAGQKWEEWLRSIGLAREHFRIENVYEYQAPYSTIEKLGKDPEEMRALLEPWMHDLHIRLAKLWQPSLIIPMGNYALYALTGKGKVAWHKKDGRAERPGITAWRGSILSYTDLHGREIPVYPTIHPAATMGGRKQADYERPCRADWARIADFARGEGFLPIQREVIVTPSFGDIRDYYEECRREGEYITFDIEYPIKKKKVQEPVLVDGEPAFYKSGKKKGQQKIRVRTVRDLPDVTLVGIANSHRFAMVISTEEGYWKSEKGLATAWQWIRLFADLPNAKNTHNGLTDAFRLAEYDVLLRNWLYDTLYMDHCENAADRHSLDYCASRDLWTVFWKHEAKDPASAAAYASNWHAFATYCGLDCCHTHELLPIRYERLQHTRRGGMSGLDFYFLNYVEEYPALLDLMLTGIRADRALMVQRHNELLARCIAIRERLKELVGYDLHTTKEISPVKLARYLYTDLALPRQYKKRQKGEVTETTDEVTVKELEAKYPEQLGVTGPLIREHRKTRKEAESYDSKKLLDADDHMRSTYSPSTEAGRLKSAENPRGTGSNGQNINRKVRDAYIAEPGCLLGEIDLAQAESRVCDILTYALTGVEKYWHRAVALPGDFDAHKETASIIYRCDMDALKREDEETYEKRRYMGKKTNHAVWRDMKGETMAEQILKETGDIVAPKECDTFLSRYRDENLEMLEYFRWCRAQGLTPHWENGKEVHYVESLWGYRLYFEAWEVSNKRKEIVEESWRRMYSFYPQNIVGILMRWKGLRVLYNEGLAAEEEIGQRVLWSHVEGHDSMVFSCPPEWMWHFVSRTVASLQEPLTYLGVEMSMPCSIKVGRNWKGEVKWDQLPAREEFEEVVYGIHEGRRC